MDKVHVACIVHTNLPGIANLNDSALNNPPNCLHVIAIFPLLPLERGLTNTCAVTAEPELLSRSQKSCHSSFCRQRHDFTASNASPNEPD